MTIPIFIVRTLVLPRREKWGIWFLLLLGCFMVAAAIARLVESVVEWRHASATDVDFNTKSIDNFLPLLFVQLEVAAGLIAVSLPALKAVLSSKNRRRRSEVECAISHSRSTSTTQWSPTIALQTLNTTTVVSGGWRGGGGGGGEKWEQL